MKEIKKLNNLSRSCSRVANAERINDECDLIKKLKHTVWPSVFDCGWTFSSNFDNFHFHLSRVYAIGFFFVRSFVRCLFFCRAFISFQI